MGAAISQLWRQTKSWDLWVGLAVGGGTVALALTSAAVRQASVPILIAEAAIGVALTSTVFAGLAVFATFFDGTYRKVLDLSGGLDEAIQPYVVVVAVSAASIVVGTVGALALPALNGTWQSVCIGASTWLCVWAVVGTVYLADLTRFHASARADLMAGVDNAERLLRDRQTRIRKRIRSQAGEQSQPRDRSV